MKNPSSDVGLFFYFYSRFLPTLSQLITGLLDSIGLDYFNNIPIYQCTNVLLYLCTNVPTYSCTIVPMYQMYQCTFIQCTNVLVNEKDFDLEVPENYNPFDKIATKE